MTSAEFSEKLDAIVDPIEGAVEAIHAKAQAAKYTQTALTNQEQVLIDTCSQQVTQLISEFSQSLQTG